MRAIATAICLVLLAVGAALAADRAAPGSDTARGRHIGPFYLADDEPTLIHLTADIEAGAAFAFRGALQLRPGATTIALDSDGGLVSESLLIAREIADLGLATTVPEGAGCYSACAYVFFAGRTRVATGELGVHQISGEMSPADTQDVLSDLLAALDDFGVSQSVITVMLRTKPDDMHVFTAREVAALRINRADLAPPAIAATGRAPPSPPVAPTAEPATLSALAGGRIAGVHRTYVDALPERTLCLWAIDYATGQWASAHDFLPYVEEATHRGYSLARCAAFVAH